VAVEREEDLQFVHSKSITRQTTNEPLVGLSKAAKFKVKRSRERENLLPPSTFTVTILKSIGRSVQIDSRKIDS